MKKNRYLRRIAQHITSILLLLASPAYGESAACCDAPLAVCERRERGVAIKTPNMDASAICNNDGFILTNRHVVEDYQSFLVKSLYWNIDKAEVISHEVPLDLAIVALNPKQIVADVSKTFAKTLSRTLYVVAFDWIFNG